MTALAQFLRYRRRLAAFSFAGKARYVGNTLCGELLARRTVGTLGLRMADISLTERCQCRCRHCYAASEASTTTMELTTEEVFSVLDQLNSMQVMEVCFSGGEPLLRKDLLEIVAHAHQQQMLPKLNTNGILLSETLVRGLSGAGLAWCMVSLDSAQAGQHDDHRQYAGCYERAVEGLKMLVRHGIPASIISCVTKELVRNGDLAEIVRLGHQLGVDTVRITFPVAMGRLHEAEDGMLTREEREKVRELLKDPIVTMENPSESSRCTAAITKLNIRANGEVTPCAVLPLSFGSVRERPLGEIWEAMAGFARMPKPRGQCPMSDPSFRQWLSSADVNGERKRQESKKCR